MIFIEVEQGSELWLIARSGKTTASRFADAISMLGGLDEKQQCYVDAIMIGGMPQKDAMIIAGYKAVPKSESVAKVLRGEDPREHSDIAHRYAADISLERVSGMPHGEPPKAWVLARGHEMEAQARMIYEARTGSFVTESGICVTEDGLFAYSSDGLVDDDGLIEIKAPIDSIKILEMLRTGDTSEYDDQMQGGLWLTGRKYCDFIMYVPELKNVGKDLYVKRIFRDEAYIENLVAGLNKFQSLAMQYEEEFRAGQIAITAIEENMNTDIKPEQTPAEELALAQSLPSGTELSPDAQLMNEAEGRARFAENHRVQTVLDPVQIEARDTEPVGPPSMKLGDIGARLGFTVTAGFLMGLGFSPAATEKNSKLFHESDFVNICAAIRRHISAVCAAY